MPNPGSIGVSFKEVWRQERQAEQDAILQAEIEGTLPEEASDDEWEQDFNRRQEHGRRMRANRNEYCSVHFRLLGPKDVNPVTRRIQCIWCYYGSKERYQQILEETNINKQGRLKKAKTTKAIA
jgi:hypothetical protein